MTYSTGHIADHPAVVASRAPFHVHPRFGAMRAAAGSLPMATTNRARLMPDKGGPGVLDQDGVGACEGFAHAAGGTLLLADQGKSQGLIDPVMLYQGALMCDSQLQPDGTISTVTDTGTMPSSIQQAWQTFGAQLAKDDALYPISRATLYQKPADDNSPLILPSPEKLYAASPYRYHGAFFLAAQGPLKLLQLLMALAAGYPVSDAIPASGSEFQGYRGGVIGVLSGPIDHANLIMDYEWLGTSDAWAKYTTALAQGDASTIANLNSFLLAIALNSWNVTWGQGDAVSGAPGGTYQANVDHLTQAEDLCALELTVAT